MAGILERIGDAGVIPVATIDHAANSIPLAAALLKGGLPVVEVTFRTGAAAEAISGLVAEFPEMLVGAGTVLNVSQAERAVAAGAQFIVSAGFSPGVVQYCLDRGVVVIPGCSTPTEITAALELDLKVVKFFPAEIFGGVGALRALGKPFGQISFIPTGGIGFHNLIDYLVLDNVWACGGSWMIKPDRRAVTRLARTTMSEVLGFSLDREIGGALLEEIEAIFNLTIRERSTPAGALARTKPDAAVEAEASLIVKTRSMARAKAYLQREGIAFCAETGAASALPPASIRLKRKAGDLCIRVVEE